MEELFYFLYKNNMEFYFKDSIITVTTDKIEMWELRRLLQSNGYSYVCNTHDKKVIFQIEE